MKFIEIFNVKHGDFGVYRDPDKNYVCVLDCGSLQPGKRLHNCSLTPNDVIEREGGRIASFPMRDILISHYHGDHFSHVCKFKKYGMPFFQKMYIPYIDFTSSYGEQLLYSLCLLQATAGVLKLRGESQFTLLKSFSSLFTDEYAKELPIRVYRGCKISQLTSNKGVPSKVLWPPKDIKRTNESMNLKRFIKKLIKTLRENNLEDAIAKTRKYFHEVKNKLKDAEIEVAKNDQSELFEQECEVGEPKEKEYIPVRKRDDINDIKKAFTKLKKAVEGFLDDLSVVFKIGNKILWMGDVTEDVLKILNEEISGKFDYFKLPHHGTRDVGVLSNVKASNLIVSLSDGKHLGGKEYKPIHRANIRNALKNNTAIYCTDGHKKCSGNLCDARENKVHCHFCTTNKVIRVSL